MAYHQRNETTGEAALAGLSIFPRRFNIHRANGALDGKVRALVPLPVRLVGICDARICRVTSKRNTAHNAMATTVGTA